MKNTDLNLYSKNLPSLESGSYEIKVTQTLHIGDTIKETYQNTAAYEVESSGFHIGEQIEQIFPDNGSSGFYNYCMPHIIFSNKSLLWEKGETPWLALLTFREDETFTIKKESEIDAVQSVYYHRETFKILEKEKLTLLELPLDLFQHIAPTNQELKYLAHVREIQLCNSQSVQFLHKKGLQSTENCAPASSVLLSNRLPGTGANTVLLVSFNGLTIETNSGNDDQSDAIRSEDDNHEKIQLVVLKKWSFVCNTETDSFSDYLKKNISADEFKLACNEDEDKKNILSPEIKNIINLGYVPLKNDSGSDKTKFYRGPLIPLLQHQKPDKETKEEYNNPAFQLGKLLCLQNRSMAEAVCNNRIHNLRSVALQHGVIELLNNKKSLSSDNILNEGMISQEIQLKKLRDLLKTLASSKTL